ncbi:MAG: hypothetical protein MUE64_04160 [Ignavibacteriaceae bacterium]|jgi:bifunctional DNA-binding transcriptional regulator/antitoxin component of YhaV-PrlF toxin-antitoxin module|nr:hypothetical protein [Ignavibacteriaceae bacterium]
MIVTKKYIQQLREKSFVDITQETEKLILERLGSEPDIDNDGFYHHYTEQDISEQIRKIIQEQEQNLSNDKIEF